MTFGIINVYERPDGTMFQGQMHRSYEHGSNGAAHAVVLGGHKLCYVVRVTPKKKNPYLIRLFRQ